MTVRVISGPAPIAIPADLPGTHAANDARIAALIAAAQAGIDGPTGWLGRALGEQTLELTRADFMRSIRLPYPPVVSIESVKYRDREGVEQTVDPGNYRSFGAGLAFAFGYAFPATECAPDAVTIRFKAGYAADKVPPSAKQAVIIGVQHLKALTEQSVFIRSEEVDGVGTETFAVSETGANVVKAATEALLMPLRVYSL